MNLKTLSITTAFFCAPLFLIAQSPSSKKLPSGVYDVSDMPGIRLKLANTNQYYNVAPIPVTTITHIISTTVHMGPYYNGKSYPELVIEFDKKGTNDLANLPESSPNNHQIGLILNNQLKQVAKLFGKLTGSKISFSAGIDGMEKLKVLKAEIDNSR
jgi:hypothetical protein